MRPAQTPDQPEPACLLALDTATEVVHAALLQLADAGRLGGQEVAQATGGAQASATTLPLLQALLARASLGWPQVRAVAFGQGPGAFTGLRTACSVAQGLALGLDVPVIALDTLMAVAESARQRDARVAASLASDPSATLWVLQDARMSEVYAAAYRCLPDQGWQQVQAPQLWSLAHLQAQVEGGCVTLAAGSALGAYPAAVAALAGPAVPDACPEGAALAVLARQAWAQGRLLDAALALPVYVRDKVAQTTAERAALRESGSAVAALNPDASGVRA
jgi:tRNA threonylcarbamoyladenosine biosynthesis protein TsaB